MTAATATLPIADYDRLRIVDILPRLASLNPNELAQVERYELVHKYRTTLLSRIDSLLRAVPDDAVGGYPLTSGYPLSGGYPLVEADEPEVAPEPTPVIDLTSYAAHDPRLWQTLLIPVPREAPETEPAKKKWFRRTA